MHRPAIVLLSTLVLMAFGCGNIFLETGPDGGAGGTGGTAGTGDGGTAGTGDGGTGGTGGMPRNQCPIYTSVVVSPSSQSVGNLIDIRTQVFDVEGDDVEVLVTSNCGEVTDPLQTADPETDESSTTFRCDEVGSCSVAIWVSDDGFAPDGCHGTNKEATSTIGVNCQPSQPTR